MGVTKSGTPLSYRTTTTWGKASAERRNYDFLD